MWCTLFLYRGGLSIVDGMFRPVTWQHGVSAFLTLAGIWIIYRQMQHPVTMAADYSFADAVTYDQTLPPTPEEASAVAREYFTWINSALKPTRGINRSESLLALVKPLDADLEALNPKCVGSSTPVWEPRGQPSTHGRIIFLKLRKVMDEANCVWWLTNGGPLMVGRSTALRDPDLDVMYICRSDLSLPYYECEAGQHYCTASASALVDARLNELLAREFQGAKLTRYDRGHITITNSPELPLCRGCSKLVDLAPAAVLTGSRYVQSGAHTPCSLKIGGKGWPCTRWHIKTIFPLQPSVTVPCRVR